MQTSSKVILAAIIIIVLGGIFYYMSPASDDNVLLRDGVNFQTVEKGEYAGHAERQNYAIDNREDWQNLWDKMNTMEDEKPELFEVDFENEMILAVFQGERSSGGHSIEITGVYEEENKLVIEGREVSPGPTCITTSAMTQPYHIVKTEKTSKSIEFNLQSELTACE